MARAEAYDQRATISVRRLKTGRWGVMAGLEVYRMVHAEIRRNGYDVFTRRASTTRWQKLGLALAAQWGLYFERGKDSSVPGTSQGPGR